MTYPNDPQGRQPENWEVQPTQYIPPAQAAQPGYVNQPGYPAQPKLNPFGTTSNEAFGIAAAVLALLGGVLGIVSFTALDWFSYMGQTQSFSNLHDGASSSFVTGFADAYFSYLAWIFLIVAVLSAVGASFPSPAVRALRIVGVVIGVAAAGLSFLALKYSNNQSYTFFLKHASVGFYLAVAAFLLAAIGAGIGTRRM